MMKKFWLTVAATGLAIALIATAPVRAQDTIKIAYIDPLSGGGATIGEHGLKHFQYLIDKINAAGGVLGGKKFELIALDNKASPQESLVQAQKAIDAGARILTQGNGSNVALALTDFVTKFNERNPDKEVLYLNYAAVDPALTNEKCSYWHFRWDADADVKMTALTSFMKNDPKIKKVYVIGQDYSFGQAVRKSAREMLKEKRPDIEIVGDELHPLLKVNDFAPYIAKIKASGADSVITGNWGQDLSLLLKAAADAGLQVNWFTYYAGGAGGPTAVRQTGLDHRVFQIVEWHANVPGKEMQDLNAEFRKKYGSGWWYLRVKNEMDMLVAAIEKAKSTDPRKIAAALEDMKYTNVVGTVDWMRKTDHQLFQTMYIASFGSGVPVDEENTGWGWKTVGEVAGEDTVTKTTCKMERPQ